jgi:phosphatidylglycerol:prolipoprotein diacylglycerol transferase
MFEHALNPVLLDFGALQVRWYGVMWALGFLIVYWYVRKSAREGLISLTDDDVDWLMVWLVAGTLLGARIFEVFVWEPGYFLSNPGEIIKIWRGGLSFHGGLVGALIAGYWFAKQRKIPFLNLCDICFVPVALGLAFGRIGNFINGELWGRITSVPWAVKFPGADGYRHPSQLYESFYSFILFGILYGVRAKKWPHGSIFALFLALYAVFRFVTEYFREPTMYIGPLTLGQALNVPMLVAGLALWYWIRKK